MSRAVTDIYQSGKLFHLVFLCFFLIYLNQIVSRPLISTVDHKKRVGVGRQLWTD